MGLLPWQQRNRIITADTKPKFGTPGYPSPLDRVRNRQNSPPDGNASFSHMPRRRLAKSGLHHATSAPRLNVIPGNGLHSFSFSPGLSKGSFGTSQSAPSGQWLFRNFVGGGSCGTVFPTTIVNPNKAVLTIDSTSKILTANDMSSLLLGHPEDELCGNMKLTDFITNPETQKALSSLASLSPMSEGICMENSLHTLPEPDILDNQGMVLFSGKVVDVDTYDNGTLPCSLWLKGLPQETDEDQRWIAVLEPVDITVAKASVDETGRILKHDSSFSALFGYADNSELTKLNICDLIPALQVPTSPHDMPKSQQENSATYWQWSFFNDVEKQQCTGQTVDCATFPLCAHFTVNNTHNDYTLRKHVFDLEIWVFSNISGLVVLDAAGKISDYNYNFTRLLFGYGKRELEGEDITHLIPTFFDDVALIQKMNSPSFDSDDSDSTLSDNETENQKENKERTNGPLFTKSKQSEATTTLMSEPSSISTPNRGFVASESKLQGSLYGSTFNSTSNVTSTGDNSQNSSQNNKAMRDITNSMNILSISQQNVSNQTNNSGLQGSPSKTRPVKDRENASDESLPKVQIEVCPDLPQDILPEDMVTSTPAVGRTRGHSQVHTIEEGSFFGVGKHKDGSDLVIIYQIRRVELNGVNHYCVWILRDPEEPGEGLRSNTNFTLASTFNETAEYSLGHAIKNEAQKSEVDLEDDSDTSSDDEGADHSQTSTDGSSGAEYSLNHSRRGNRESSSACPEEGEDLLLAGDYSNHYSVLRQIGKGAFGCVKMSYRNSDGLMVVTKFIKKSKVYQDSWVDDLLLRKRVPLEVSLLMTLDHPNIVSVFDMFENDDYFQLVMEKWGAGMDLFEFIDRNPLLDEPLAAYMFRQIVSALTYLHSLNIIHRDVKDENVILNNRFHVKLIDFGSSAFTKPGKMFSQFAGTVEYCSPEVLKGNKYSGYELEVWSLGVTLYTLMYGENPFYDVDETIKAELTFPVRHSLELTALLNGMLQKDPKARMTLEEVEAHQWTQLECDIDDYVFEEIIRCSQEEANPRQYITEYSESDSSISTASNSFVYENAIQSTRRSLSFTPQGTKNDNDHIRMQRSATSLSSSRIGNEVDDDDSIYDHSASVGASRTSTSQSMSSVRSTITIDSSSFSCCSPASDSGDSSETQLQSSQSSSSVTYYDNVSSCTLSGRSSEGSINLEKTLARYYRLSNPKDDNGSDYENVNKNGDSEYENVNEDGDSEYENAKDFDDSDSESIREFFYPSVPLERKHCDLEKQPHSIQQLPETNRMGSFRPHNLALPELQSSCYTADCECSDSESSISQWQDDDDEEDFRYMNSDLPDCDNPFWHEGNYTSPESDDPFWDGNTNACASDRELHQRGRESDSL
ncbi:PAS domain-containing serine/threonine-protein kinase-like isoform X3 [Penaeus monodon]|uniref:PAS domain-containing serine/threonine-protein kinase-like isoform X3 n=1 Tax=Penaeus monodon TaxID=6687 RepID=UPI0018A7B2A6|nr:PAS domain-containing serine/threonine-protein kinase-like isoform X3 [Penaeus monodon]